MGQNRRLLRIWLGCLLLGGLTPLRAIGQTVAIDGRANVFAAGLAAVPTFFEWDGMPSGVLPTLLSLPSGTGRSLQVTAVTGGVTCCGNDIPPAGADGGGYPGHNVNGYGGVSGIVVNRFLFLSGVFLGDDPLATPAPPPLDFASGLGASFISVAPQIGQLFYIGDGRRGIGDASAPLQTFFVPDGATRLFLGFADRGAESADPAFYNDNGGSLQATFAVTAPSVAPEPTPLALLATGLLALGGLAAGRRRSHS